MYKKGTVLVCPNCGWVEGTMPESPQHLTPGTLLQDKYLVGRVLGQGGFGITYLGWDTQLDMKLAIKEYMPRDFATRNTGQPQITFFTGNVKSLYENGLHKFLEEAKILAKYNNQPGIVSVRDFFKENGTAYLVMYYLDGIDLKKYVEQVGGRLSFEQALSILNPVLEALATVHKDGILHRDISPDNIYITTAMEVKLLDFGAARHAMNDSNKSLSVILKPGYAPEEQYRSKGKQGPWTDIYATAATFYRLITGMVPPESLDRLEHDTLIPPSQLGVAIPPSAEAALLKALSLKAQDRFQNMLAFQRALHSSNLDPKTTPIFLTTNPTQPSQTNPFVTQPQPPIRDTNITQPISVRPVSPQPMKKKKTGLIIGGILGGGVLLIGLLFGFLLVLGSLSEENPEPKPDPVTPVTPVDPVDPAEPADVVQVTVPLLYDLTEEEAIAEIEKAGLVVGEITREKNLYTNKGRVFLQSLESDSEVNQNTPINISINSGIELPVDANTIHTEGLPLMYDYWSQAIIHYQNKEWEQSLEGHIVTLEIARELQKAAGLSAEDLNEARQSEAYILETMSMLKNELDFSYHALQDMEESITIFKELHGQNLLEDVTVLGNAFGNLGWTQLLNADPKEALNSLEEGIKYSPENISVQINLAHAFLLNDHFRDAFKYYRKNKDLNDPNFENQKVSTTIEQDFVKLLEAGNEHPDIDFIKVNMLGIGVDTDEKQIRRTIDYQTDTMFAGDLEAYASTYAYEPGSAEYENIINSYKDFFTNNLVTEASVKEFSIESQTADSATVLVTDTFKYQDNTKKEISEEVTYRFILIKTSSPLPWRISQLEVVDNQVTN
jgi:serine/threonine protein kinase